MENNFFSILKFRRRSLPLEVINKKSSQQTIHTPNSIEKSTEPNYTSSKNSSEYRRKSLQFDVSNKKTPKSSFDTLKVDQKL